MQKKKKTNQHKPSFRAIEIGKGQEIQQDSDNLMAVGREADWEFA